MAEWLEFLASWMHSHRGLLWGTGIASGVMFLGTLIVIPLLLTWLPEDYFLLAPEDRQDSWTGRHPALRITAKLLKNVVGLLFVVAGIGMLVLPGQGILTILVGIVLLDLPGKRNLEVALLRRRQVHRAVDWLRKKGNRPPLQLPQPNSLRSAPSESPPRS